MEQEAKTRRTRRSKKPKEKSRKQEAMIRFWIIQDK